MIGSKLIFRALDPRTFALRQPLSKSNSTPVVRGLMTLSQLSPEITIKAKLYWSVPVIFMFLITYAKSWGLLLLVLPLVSAILGWNLRSQLADYRRLLRQLSAAQKGNIDAAFGA